MANKIDTAQLIARQTAEALESKLGFAAMVHRDHSKEFGPGKTGDTVNIRAPLYFRVQEGPAISVQNIEDRSIPLTINRNPVVAYPFSNDDASLKEAALSERFSMPAARALATEIERSVLAEVNKGFWDTSGAWTTTPPAIFDFTEMLKMKARLSEAGTPLDSRISAITEQQQVSLSDTTARLGATTAPSTTAYREGEIPMVAGSRPFATNFLPVQVNGARVLATAITITSPAAVTYATATANNYTQTVTLASTTADAPIWLRAGEVITFAGCYAVEPVSKIVYPHLQNFVVMSDTPLASNAASVVVSPPMITTGAYQTVSALPSNGAAVTIVSSGNASLSATPAVMMHKDAITLATIPLVKPQSATYWGSMSFKGWTVNVSAGYDVNNRSETIRFDVLMGIKVINPAMIVRSRGRVS